MQADLTEHIENAMAISVYSAIPSALSPGGKLYLHTPNLDFFMERAKDIGVLKQFPEHIAHYNILKILHPLGKLPVVDKYFHARLWIEASV